MFSRYVHAFHDIFLSFVFLILLCFAILVNFSIGLLFPFSRRLEMIHLFSRPFLNTWLKLFIQHMYSNNTYAYRFVGTCAFYSTLYLPDVLNNHIGINHSNLTSHFPVLIAHWCFVYTSSSYLLIYLLLIIFCIWLIHVNTFLFFRNEMQTLLVIFLKISIVCSFTWMSLEISPTESLEEFA